ncbi:MAG TPA: chromosome segregation protein SMC [Burkholderiaceae bacterium]|nr:chromosome segregation protein SMC [Burkholderiaceae bacterium]
MRLRQIKLAGFKSFVDPTQIDVPGRLVGVVGPNGCGKSNVIDAVRWVLGESKAAELRGESMQDVIFNGAVGRKPGGRASVELVFDNSEGRIGGEWGRFSELSVKRILTRDNTSTYVINNQQVRRRDVHDLFLGTGLGPRAYAIIGQGMISRIVEARPEELRVFLEEAAGVTKYKERRRETETRLADTRENLLRVSDVVRELDGQIEHLRRQAELARQYRDLTERHGRAQALLWLTRQEQSASERNRFTRDIEQAEAQIESQVAELRAVELRLEQERDSQYGANDAANAAHAELMRINTEIARLEAEIRTTMEERARLAARIESLTQSRLRREEEQVQLRGRAAELQHSAQSALERLEQARAACGAVDSGLPQLESASESAREALTAARAKAASSAQEIANASQQMQAFERQANGLIMRRERLVEEQRQLGQPDADRLGRLQAEAAAAQSQYENAEQRGVQAEARERELQSQRGERTERRSQASAELHKLEARLHAVQETLTNIEADERLDPWLREQGLESLPRLFQRLDVEAGWETAIEAVLRERVDAIEVSRLEPMAAFGQLAPPARVSFFSAGGDGSAASERRGGQPEWRRLTEVVSARSGVDVQGVRAVLEDWLAGIYVQPDLQSALAARSRLAAGEQFIVASGHRVSRHAVRFFAADDRKAGLLARKREAENLERQVKAQRLIDEQAAEELTRFDAQVRQAQQEAQSAREAAGRLRTQVHELQLEAVRLGELIERIRYRGGQIDTELEELGVEEQELGRQRDAAERRFAELDEALGQTQEAVEVARLEEERSSEALREQREQSRQRETERQRVEFERAATLERISDVEHAIAVAAADVQRLGTEIEQTQLEVAKLDDSAARGGLEQWLQQRVAAEQAVVSARALVDEWMQKARLSEEQRQKIERGLQPRRDRVTELKLKEQAARLAVEQFERQLAEAGAEIESLRAQLPGAASAAQQEGEIAALAQAIADLGAVNLAALQELETATERQGFLHAQSTDLQAAVSTLEDAIRRIDRETREQLQRTFDEVNRHFGDLFPRLFGGGEARLTMTGEEILDSGVLVTAQPPGKRNSSIHLLSGGEKALAATALVFALFKLNPAPFCLLDEVDAPLDDANTERFCQLVRSMTEATQFLFITHNKLAMEMAEQLIGVTMQEQGVSRIVAVDIDSAVQLTAEAA